MHSELMRVFKDLELAEQLGTGIIRILKIYEFSDNFIRANFKFGNQSLLSLVKEINNNKVELGKEKLVDN